MKENTLNHQFTLWLEKPENKKTLKNFAASVLKKMQGKHLFYNGQDPNAVKENPALGKEIIQEFIIFFMEDETALKTLVNGGPEAVKNTRRFLWSRIIDKSRMAKGNQDIYKDTRRLFYRHVLDVLSQSPEFFKFKTNSHGICFGLSKQPPRLIFPDELLMGIPYPPDLPLTLKGINTKTHILDLACYFWKAGIDLADDPGLQIRHIVFLEWIQQFVSIKTAQVDNFPTSRDEDEKINPIVDHASPKVTDSVKQDYLTGWALNFFNRLKETEKKVFFYFECRGLKHEEISRRMGKKGNLSYQRNQLRKQLKSFLRPLEWVSPDYEYLNGIKQNPDDFIFFTKQLCRRLGSHPGLQE